MEVSSADKAPWNKYLMHSQAELCLCKAENTDTRVAVLKGNPEVRHFGCLSVFSSRREERVRIFKEHKAGVLFTFSNTDFIFWGWEKACLTKSAQVNIAYKAVITPETRLDVTYTRLARRVHASLIFRAYCL